jgi:hypothetical protein
MIIKSGQTAVSSQRALKLSSCYSEKLDWIGSPLTSKLENGGPLLEPGIGRHSTPGSASKSCTLLRPTRLHASECTFLLVENDFNIHS